MGVLKSLLGSKKAAAMIAGVLMGAFGKKIGLDPDSVTQIVGAIIAYIIGQGIADHGKGVQEVYVKNASAALADTSKVPGSGTSSGSVGL